MKTSFRFGPFEVRPAERLVLRDSVRVNLGARATDLLLLLIEHRDRAVGKAELLDRVWAGLVVEEANIHVQVSALRKELGAGAIVTIPGRGYRFVAPLIGEAGPPASAGVGVAAMTNMPAELDELIGRDDDVARLQEAVGRCRLVTVLGPGGIGKTRLVRRVCRDLVPRYPHGLWWVDLAALSGAEQLLIAIAHAARIQLAGDGADLAEHLVQGLGPRHLLLVLDNCEHLVEPVVWLIRALHSRAPGVRILATSQEPLKMAGGLDYRLGPLSLPRPGATLEQARASGALALLELRAKAIDQRFRIDAGSIEPATEVVRRLDGNALAIEMAAARAPLLGLSLLSQRLDERFRMLRRLPNAGDARHETLQAMLDWSNSLLSDTERQLMQQLSVFVGSFRIDVAEAVLPGSPPDAWMALDTLSSLVDKSLVQIESLEPPRYRLAESVRLYFQAQLRQRNAMGEAQSRHCAAMAALGSEAESRFWTQPEAEWMAHYAADYDDLQAAFDHACASGDAGGAARTGEALLRMDHLRSVLSLRRQRAQALLALLPRADAHARAIIWGCAASHGLISIEGLSRADAARQAVDAWRGLADPWRLHFALGFLASERSRLKDLEGAEALLAECHRLERPDWPPRRLMWGASAASGVAINRGDGQEYRRVTRKELELAERAGAERAAAWSRLKLADAALMAGDIDEAIALGEAAVQALRRLDQPSNLGLALGNLCAARLLGDRPGALAAATEALPLMWRTGWGYLLADSLALLAARAGLTEEAARLLGYADAWYARHDDARQPNEARLAAAAAALLDDAGAPEDARRGRSQGRELDDLAARAVAEAILASGAAGPDADSSPLHRPTH